MAGSKPGERRGGRKAGTPNKTTTALREAILQAADEVNAEGKIGYLKWLAVNNSGAFSSLLGKVLPTTLATEPGKPLQHEDVTDYTDEMRARALMAFLTRVKAKSDA